MRAGIVKGSWMVLSRDQWDQIRKWKKDNLLTDVFFDVWSVEDPWKKIALLKPYIDAYRHYQILSFEVSEAVVMQLEQDSQLAQGNYHLVDVRVRRAMILNDVYRTEIAHYMLKPNRITHVDSMTALTVEFAGCHGVNEEKARIAGLFHDCTKRIGMEEGMSLMKRCASKAIERHPATWHQYTGAYVLRKDLGIDDEEILRAIRHHVDGDDPHPLSQCLYLADKLDPSRGYDSSAVIELGKKDLDLAVKKERRLQIEYLKKEGKDPDR